MCSVLALSGAKVKFSVLICTFHPALGSSITSMSTWGGDEKFTSSILCLCALWLCGVAFMFIPEWSICMTAAAVAEEVITSVRSPTTNPPKNTSATSTMPVENLILLSFYLLLKYFSSKGFQRVIFIRPMYGSASMIKLYAKHGCPFCIMVETKLKQLGLEYEVEWVGSDRPKIVLDHGGTVPVIQDGDVVMGESADIIEYLDKKYGR